MSILTQSHRATLFFVMCILTATGTASGQSLFVPFINAIPLEGNEMPDTEYDAVGLQCVWRQPNGGLFTCPLDFQSGKFDFSAKVLLDNNVAPITGDVATGNGPEWSYARGNSIITYTYQNGETNPANWLVKIATKDAAGVWSTQLVPTTASPNGTAPRGTQNRGDTDPLIGYYFQGTDGIRKVAWQSLQDPLEGGVLPFATTSPFQWGVDSRTMVTATKINGMSQVVVFDTDRSKTYTQVSELTNAVPNRVLLWKAPEYGDKPVILAELCRLNQKNTPRLLGLYGLLKEKWEPLGTIFPPSAGLGFDEISSVKHVVYGGKSYIYFALKGKTVQGSEIWMCNIEEPITYTLIAGPAQEVGSEDPEHVVLADGLYLYLNQRGGSQCLQAWTGLTGSYRGVPHKMSPVPKGTFRMGDSFNEGVVDETPLHDVTLSRFYMDRYNVTSSLWKRVRGWANENGYDLPNLTLDEGNLPVSATWYDAVKFCNARSEMEGRIPAYYTDAEQTVVYRTGVLDLQNVNVKWKDAGYRLPTEAEWEYAARGGLDGKRFSNGNTIDHDRANYFSTGGYTYDEATAEGYNPLYVSALQPYLAPVASFERNGFGLCQTTGNLAQWCWDWHASYRAARATDPHGPDSGDFTTSYRVIRGGSWSSNAFDCRVSRRLTSTAETTTGFRTVLPY